MKPVAANGGIGGGGGGGVWDDQPEPGDTYLPDEEYNNDEYDAEGGYECEWALHAGPITTILSLSSTMNTAKPGSQCAHHEKNTDTYHVLH